MSELTCMVCELRSILISTDASASGMEKMPQHKAQAPRMARMTGSFGRLARPAPEGTLISQVSCKSQSSSKVYKKYCLCCGEQRCSPRAAVNFSKLPRQNQVRPMKVEAGQALADCRTSIEGRFS